MLPFSDPKPEGIVRRRGRRPKQIAATQTLVDLDALKAKGMKDWRHFHPERRNPLNWEFASEFPILGGLMLEAVYGMSGPGCIIESGATAQSYQINIRSFFRWLASDENLLGKQLGGFNGALPPDLWQEYKSDLDKRVAAGAIGSKTAYQYKGSAARVLQRIWHDNNDVLGPGWHERSFGLDEFIDDTKQREPYSAAEARRIIDHSTAILIESAQNGLAEDPYDYLVEIACYTALSLRLALKVNASTR